MPDNNPLIEAFKYLFSGSPQYGAGLFSPQNIRNAMGRTGQEIQTIMTPTPTSPSPIDLGTINIQRQRQAQSAVPQPPAGINMPSSQQQRQPINWQAIADIGIPALSALIGSVAPSTLPAAAGIATGYTGAREKQREENKTKRFLVFDEDTGQVVDSGQVIKSTDEIMKKSKSKEDFRDSLIRDLLGIEIPTTKTGESLKQNKMRVRRIETGESGTIDSNEFDSSLYEKL